jgi:hypothetical protein
MLSQGQGEWERKEVEILLVLGRGTTNILLFNGRWPPQQPPEVWGRDLFLTTPDIA